MSTLTTAPLSLVKDTVIIARVIAANVIGAGAPTENASGVTVCTVPEAPSSTPVRGSSTNKNQIQVTYSLASAQNGGSAVTSLNLWWNRGASDNTWESLTGLDPSSLAESFTALGLSPGEDYQFKFRAKNVYGFGGFSAVSTIKAAKSPEAPNAPTTAIRGTFVGISWALPDIQGSSIVSYSVQILAGDGVTYVQENTFCIGTDAQVISYRY